MTRLIMPWVSENFILLLDHVRAGQTFERNHVPSYDAEYIYTYKMLPQSTHSGHSNYHVWKSRSCLSLKNQLA